MTASADIMDSLPQLSLPAAGRLQTPTLLLWTDRLNHNIRQMVATAGSAERLRPHCKTHKMHEVTRRLIGAGITQHKAATPAEAQMLANAGAGDVLLASQVVGPAVSLLQQLVRSFPETTFSVIADDAGPVSELSREFERTGTVVGVMLDLDVGQHRTGVAPDSSDADDLYALIGSLPGLVPAGLHIYDGHQQQTSVEERRGAVCQAWQPVQRLIDRLEASGHQIPELVCGGTPTFPVYTEFEDPRIRLSPGTCVLHDAGYGSHFPDLKFVPAAALATRVVSRPTANRITLDLGHKAVAADPPDGSRVVLPELPGARFVLHNEEHLVVESDRAEEFSPGDLLLAIPVHICPTTALHDFVTLIEHGEIVERWNVTARHRLTADAENK